MKKFSLSLLSLAIVGFMSCSDKETDNQTAQSGEPVMATFKISYAAKSYAIGNDEPGSTEENQVDMVEFYMFDSNGVRDAADSAYDYSYHKHTGNIQNEISFLVKSGSGKKVLVAINANLQAQTGKSYADMEKLIHAKLLDDSNSRQMGGGEFTMSGKQTCNILENSTTNEVTINVSRLATKIEAPVVSQPLLISIPDEDIQDVFEDDQLTKDDIEFEMTGYALLNGLDKSHVFTNYNSADDELTDWTNWAPGGMHFETTYDAQKQITAVYSGMVNGSPWLNNTTLYVYENQPSDDVEIESGIVGFKKSEVYAFLIQGELKAPSKTLTRYWRVNLIRDDNYRIFRNTIYRVTLTELRTIGYDNPKDGEEDEDNGKVVPKNDQTGLQATIEILPWRVRTQHTDF